MPSMHMANEQKLSALTVRQCNSHGALGDGGQSIGKVVVSPGSSFRPSCHTASLLSLPCLG